MVKTIVEKLNLQDTPDLLAFYQSTLYITTTAKAHVARHMGFCYEKNANL